MEDSDQSRSREALRAWQENAAFWDEQMGEGNNFHLTLVRPAVERLLGAVQGQRVLDVGCGNGLFTRRLVDPGANVVAVDGGARRWKRRGVLPGGGCH